MLFESSDFTIRKARPSDRNHLRAMQATSMRTLAARCYSRAEIEAFMTFVGTMDDRLIEDGTYYVVEADGHPVASGGWSRQSASHVARLADPTAAKLRNLFVHPDWARHGLGRKLAERAEADAFMAGFDRMELNALLSGVPFCRALGYRPSRQIELKLPDGVLFRGLTMNKLIGDSEPAVADGDTPAMPLAAIARASVECCYRQAA